MDILTLNRYSGWYSDSGHLELIQYQMYNELVAFTKKFEKPILVTEYGAGSLSGLHSVRIAIIYFHYNILQVFFTNSYKIRLI